MALLQLGNLFAIANTADTLDDVLSHLRVGLVAVSGSHHPLAILFLELNPVALALADFNALCRGKIGVAEFLEPGGLFLLDLTPGAFAGKIDGAKH